ncbi:PH domain-containing protein [Smaragdicoccus niigatensis]|uniref:PH domain-containing protein n=1 Tax=Smaragdicoccus niigatensis TaxID=359359 RepID=UPI00037E4419|nr:PH domain-containing protein [Smaragdicoccus niigatensis]
MDNSSSSYQQQWSTPIAGLSIIGTLGVVLLCAAIFTQNNAPGRVIATLAGLGALLVFALGLRRRPRLAIEPGPALVLGRLRHPEIYLPSDIARIRATSFSRIGRKVHLLELDLRRASEEHFVVLSRWDLGADPRDVLAVLERAGLTG